MSDEIVNKIVEKRVTGNWSATDVKSDGVRYIPKRGTPYIDVQVNETDSERTGATRYRRSYLVSITVNVPKNTGSRVASQYADQLKNLFEGYSEGGFNCIKGRVQRLGNSEEWYRKTVFLTCRYAECK